ncbi:hypothetical protein [Chryseobacterium camelliae]|uniref:hypothetical protein n=1 Tax=Chryseobacterium camelliae TaxID=1265445 RepID=UPI0028615C4F|nr:hypothetical protein [Chryseobacterium camelliae]MDR6516660.1 hypothetical protein [Chryseobacterium camelliae]
MGQGNCWAIPSESGTEKFIPAELLRNSVIVFDSSELDLQLQAQKIKKKPQLRGFFYWLFGAMKSPCLAQTFR